jgi:uncharacterized protein YecT (DUF1311 family)
VIVAFLAVAAARADALPDCFKVPNATQAQLNDCAYRQYQEADRALNVQWRKTAEAARGVDRATYPRLLNGQRAWLRYREETCRWGKDTFSGTIAPMNYFDCMEDITRNRTEELKMLSTSPNSGEPL